ncbi:MAG: hypothetical protein LQ343_004968 [Gyalolechia ehrenbergii]|nr:MAG: hypothetical protein LQ343_004968 [Gyalolechia ehrenbergii]
MSASLPALLPPAGVQANFENPQSRSCLTVIPCAAIVGVMIIFVFMRMYTKVYILKSVGWDDLYEFGFGVHQWDITQGYLMALMSKEGKCLSALWGPTMFFTKLSLLLLYYRIFAPDRITKYLVFFGIFYCFILYTSFLLLTFLLCQSLLMLSCQHQWDMFLLTSSGLNVASDAYLLIIPLAAVAKLHMPTKQKLKTSAVFFAGMLACLSGILALYYRTRLLYIQDLTWHFTPVFVFTVLEINTGIIVSCMPTMPALIHDIRSQIFPSSTQQNKTNRSESRTRLSKSERKIGSTSHHHRKKTSSLNGDRRQVRFHLPIWQPVELDSTPVRMMEEAHVVGVGVGVGEPRSYFSDDSEDGGGGGEYGWLS